ncbi:hypothetical protein HHK36_001453 [Tetracentron sinense]|uniref:RNA helicase n=1 Tax=Tetracentron sinense TaxID=13715 RepID=A0A835A2S6_TETSI|nr:hypothetical protein HHK36_001453 [Tetracentron sinense]
MNFLFRKSASTAFMASKRTLSALISMEAFRVAPSVTAIEATNNGVFGGEFGSFWRSRAPPKLGFCFGVRDFHFSTGPLEFRASSVSRAEYAVDDFLDEEKSSGKKVGGVSDEGLEISKLGISQEIVSTLAKKGITKLFPIQRAVLEPAMQGRDMIGRARTGTGKTLAFGIPIMDKIIRFNAKHGRGRNPLALVLAPTRELARQVEKEFHETGPNLDTICVYGGVPISRQMNTLDYGVDVVVGTPGRIIDLLKRGSLNLSEVQFVVLDEADQMLAVGFDEDVEIILDKLPQKRQSMMFSATMPSWIRKLSQKYLNDPLTIDLVGDSDQKLPEGISLYSVASDMYGKASIIGPLITEHAKGGKCIVFTQTKRDADRLAYAMGRSFKCEPLHGDISQNQRERTLSGFRDGHFNILVATDVAARGLDIPNVDLIIHYELPSTSEIFVHRSGRTGRAGKKGSAILIYTEQQARAVRVIERDVGCKFIELPKIATEGGSRDMFVEMGGGGRLALMEVLEAVVLVIQVLVVLVGRSGGGFGSSGRTRSGNFGGSRLGRQGGFGDFGGSGRSSGFGEFGSPDRSSGFTNSRTSPGRFGDSGSSRFGSFDDDSADDGGSHRRKSF